MLGLNVAHIGVRNLLVEHFIERIRVIDEEFAVDELHRQFAEINFRTVARRKVYFVVVHKEFGILERRGRSEFIQSRPVFSVCGIIEVKNCTRPYIGTVRVPAHEVRTRKIVERGFGIGSARAEILRSRRRPVYSVGTVREIVFEGACVGTRRGAAAVCRVGAGFVVAYDTHPGAVVFTHNARFGQLHFGVTHAEMSDYGYAVESVV